MQTYDNPQIEYDWWAGNARFADKSGLFIVAHVAQAALIAFWAGAFTLFEISQYRPDIAMAEHGLNFTAAPSHFRLWSRRKWANHRYLSLFRDWLNSSDFFGSFGSRSLISPVKSPRNPERFLLFGKKFHFDWSEPRQLGVILGHHLLFLGIAAIIISGQSYVLGGLYDATIGTCPSR
jgi:hypothetical protein